MKTSTRLSWPFVFFVGCVAILQTQYAHAATFHQGDPSDASPNSITVQSGELHVRVQALREDILRVRYWQGKVMPEDASWAVLPAARQSTAHVRLSDAYGFTTSVLSVQIDPHTLSLTLRDKDGNLLRQDSAPIRFQGHSFEFSQSIADDEHFFGLGDKTGAFDRRGQAFRLWNTDAYGWQESTDPLYKSIPFYLSYRAGTTLGVLIDNTWPSSFDFGKTQANIFQYRAEDGPVDIYLLYGPSAKHVLASYAWLTGPTPLPPLWALGFQQSRYSYMTQARVLEVAGKLREDKIPADAIYLDIDYQLHNRPFTVDTTAFPDIAGMVSILHKEQFHIVVITDLHIADLPHQNYAPYDSGIAGDHFVKKSDGSIFSGPVWPGPSVFPDFTRQQTRAWWGTLYKDLDHIGIDGFWNDMNEPSVFNTLLTIPNDAIHRIDEPGFASRTATHREIHNVYGMENSRATYEGQLALKPNMRPFILTRATYAGGQRYAATWTGDNSATWNHLRLTTSMLKNLGLSGFSLAGADVGGFAGTPMPELLTKWIEIASFQPIDRDHAEKGTGDHEPWAGTPEQEEIRRHFINERYKLLPYLYTTMESSSRAGLPLLRPIFLEFPNATPDRHPIDIDLDTSGEFMVGPDLLVAAAPFPDKTDDYDAKFPSSGWYDYWTGKHVDAVEAKAAPSGLQAEGLKGPTLSTIRIHPQLATLPVFVRPGAILPIAPIVQSTDELPTGALTLRIFPGPGCAGEMYQDDGTTFAYKHGDFLRMTFACESTPDDSQLTIHIGKHLGKYHPWWKELAVEVNGVSKKPKSVTVNGHNSKFDSADDRVIVTVPDDGEGFDIILHL